MKNSIIVINTLGKKCPIPVQKTRKIIKSANKGSIIHLLSDDEESLHDIPALLNRLGLESSTIIPQDAGWRFEIII